MKVSFAGTAESAEFAAESLLDEHAAEAINTKVWMDVEKRRANWLVTCARGVEVVVG